MSRRYGECITVAVDAAGQPKRFRWRRRTYRVEVIACWQLRDKWWDSERHSGRLHYRLMTRDMRFFEIYREQAPCKLPRWVLDTVLD